MILFTASHGTVFRYEPGDADVIIQASETRIKSRQSSAEILALMIPAIDLQEFVSKVLAEQARTRK
jgi:hypothetical protein